MAVLPHNCHSEPTQGRPERLRGVCEESRRQNVWMEDPSLCSNRFAGRWAISHWGGPKTPPAHFPYPGARKGLPYIQTVPAGARAAIILTKTPPEFLPVCPYSPQHVVDKGPGRRLVLWTIRPTKTIAGCPLDSHNHRQVVWVGWFSQEPGPRALAAGIDPSVDSFCRKEQAGC